jgi:GT2 family glycosyltransferase
MSVHVSLVLVTYRSSAVAPLAVASFREEVRRHGVTSEVVIVDHSADDNEAARLRSLDPEKLLVLPNRGYAAGVNAGFGAASGGTIVVGNPDLAFGKGSAAALLGALDEGWSVVGPQFVLGDFLFPPADLQTPREEIGRWLAGRHGPAWRRRLRLELSRWLRVWTAAGPVAVPALSGALLAFRRRVFDLVGPWDEGYFLYFEEADWLRRAAGKGLRFAQVPAARVEHQWGHAADPRTSFGHVAASRARFMEAWFGWRGRLLRRLQPGATPLRATPLPASAASLPRGRLWWLLSPTALGMPAAGFVGAAEELMRALERAAAARAPRLRYTVIALDAQARMILGTWAWEPRRA